ncbi:MAG: efflux RND transporter permease subunit, partial [bacterium]|nr:efflux RND transporter permease subunit [bacterium]
MSGRAGDAPGRVPVLQRIVDVFLAGGLPPFVIIVSLLAGVWAISTTPREEEPQIVVPMADVEILAPGLSVGEVERHVTTRLEKLLSQIDGVEHVYSMSMPGRAVVTARFFVGEDREDSLVKTYNKIFSNTDLIPASVTSWVVRPIEIDDVPIVVATLFGSEGDANDALDDFALRRVAEEIEIELQAIPGTNRTAIHGGRPRVIRVELDADALAARRTSALEVAWALGVSNTRQPTAGFDRGNRHFELDAGHHFSDVPSLQRAVVNVVDGTPVFLTDVAKVVDGPAEPAGYSWMGFGPAEEEFPRAPELRHAVHVSVAKQKGRNAVVVAEQVALRLEALSETHLPEGVHLRITRNQGETADQKVDELLEALLVAILIVIGLIAWSLGWREGLVVAMAVPITFALTLLVNQWAGYTINRVTLFALILSLGLVVDDPIVDVENIHRHLRRGAEPPLRAVRSAVNEVRPPIILATLAVIISFLPMLFITGMMGPYMRPMALNVPVAMAMSMLVAFTVTPWLAWKALRHMKPSGGQDEEEVEEDSTLDRVYRKLLGPLLERRGSAWLMLGGVLLLFVVAIGLGVIRAVPLKMLPFDNKNELQIVVDPPEGTPLERTDAILRKLAGVLQQTPEVRDFQIYAGFASPMDFNGMVRHYFLRRGPHVGEIRVNLAAKRNRSMQSHEIALRIRPELERVAREEGAKIAIVEVPPGPPVLATITAEIHGEPGVPYERIQQAALATADRLALEPALSDVDTSVEEASNRWIFVTDQEKAALSGVAVEDVASTVDLALTGRDVTVLHLPDEVNPLPVRLRLPRGVRSGREALAGLAVKGRPGVAKLREPGGLRDAPVPVVRLGEIGSFAAARHEQTIYHKDLRPVAFVYAEPVGRSPAEAVADVSADLTDAPLVVSGAPRSLAGRTYLSNGGGSPWSLPEGVSVEWLGEGELKITADVFRDLGIAFGVALIGIYFLLVVQT